MKCYCCLKELEERTGLRLKMYLFCSLVCLNKTFTLDEIEAILKS
jgi:hypothetical protein